MVSPQRFQAVAGRLGTEEVAAAHRHPNLIQRAQAAARASADVLRLDALVLGNFTLKAAQGGTGLESGGFYDPRRGRIVIVDSGGPKSELKAVLAHELTHALDDERFGIPEGFKAPGSERSVATRALAEGDASFVEALYRERYLGERNYARASLAQERQFIASGSFDSPPVLREIGLFPYTAGTSFIRSLYESGGWARVNEAWRHPPTTTQQVLDPRDWAAHSRPANVSLGARRVVGHGWRLVGGGAVGEADTALFVGLSPSNPQELGPVAGWDGGRFQDWRLRSEPADCRLPCRSARAAVLGWRWQSTASLAQFAAVLRHYFDAELFSQQVAPNAWRVQDGYAAYAFGSTTAGAAFAPSRSLAIHLAQAAAGQ